MNLTGLIMFNETYLSNSPFVIQIYKNDGTLIATDSDTTDSKGGFNWDILFQQACLQEFIMFLLITMADS